MIPTLLTPPRFAATAGDATSFRSVTCGRFEVKTGARSPMFARARISTSLATGMGAVLGAERFWLWDYYNLWMKKCENTTEMFFLPVITFSWTITVVGFGERNLIFMLMAGPTIMGPRVATNEPTLYPVKIGHSYWKWPFIVDLPINNRDFP